jgi:hypothetical protein
VAAARLYCHSEPGRPGAASAVKRRLAGGGEVRFRDPGGVHRTPETGESAVRLSLVLRFRLSTHMHHTGAISPLTIFRMNTSKKSPRNSCRMNTYKNKGLKVPLESALTKKRGGTPLPERKSPVRGAFAVSKSGGWYSVTLAGPRRPGISASGLPRSPFWSALPCAPDSQLTGSAQ